MSSQETARIAIIGAGIGGLATAIALLQEGFQPEVYEQATTLREVGAAVVIRPPTVKILQDWGMTEEYNRYRVRIEQIELLRASDGRQIQRDWQGWPGDSANSGEESWTDSVHRVDLHAHLLSLVPTETVHLSRKCQNVLEHDDFVEIQFTDGTSERAACVIAADGIHSVVRPLMNEDTAIFSGMQGHRAVLPYERLKDLFPTNTLRIWGKETHESFLLLPVQGGNGVAFDALLPTTQRMEESWRMMMEPAELIAKLIDFEPRVREVVRRTEGQVGVFSLYDRDPITHWNTARLALLGDAAHPMLPFAGQGANQAIQDASVLATCLRGVSNEGIPAALQRYSSLRIPVTRETQRQSRSFPRPGSLK